MTTYSRRIGVAVGLAAALVVVVAAGAVAGTRSITDDLRPQVEGALSGDGLTEVDAQVRGREVELTDGSPAELARARALVESVRGVGRVSVTEGVVGGEQDPSDGAVTVRLRADGVDGRITGTVPDATSSAAVKVAAARAFGGSVGGDLVIDPTVAPVAWLTDLPGLLVRLDVVEGLALDVDAGGLRIAGTVAKKGDATGITEAAEDLSGLTVSVDLEVAAKDEER